MTHLGSVIQRSTSPMTSEWCRCVVPSATAVDHRLDLDETKSPARLTEWTELTTMTAQGSAAHPARPAARSPLGAGQLRPALPPSPFPLCSAWRAWLGRRRVRNANCPAGPAAVPAGCCRPPASRPTASRQAVSESAPDAPGPPTPSCTACCWRACSTSSRWVWYSVALIRRLATLDYLAGIWPHFLIIFFLNSSSFSKRVVKFKV